MSAGRRVSQQEASAVMSGKGAMVARVGRPSSRRELSVWMNGIRVGFWAVSPTAGHQFAYDAGWLEQPECRPISLSMPLSQGTEPFKGNVVEAYFDNLLPDSKTIRARVAQHYGVNPNQSFALLEQIGRDCVGALQLLPPDAEPPDVRCIDARPITNDEVSKLLDQALSGAPIERGEPIEDLRISLAGAQEKSALLLHEGRWHIPRGSTPTTHILKLPLGRVGTVQADFSTSIENEWLCARLLKAFELPVAECDIAHFGRHKALVVTRFDRKYQEGGWWARLTQEDFCQVYGVPPENKYQDQGGPGIDSILETLRGSVSASQDRRNFLRAQLIFWLLAAPDGHAKNFSLFIEQGGRYRMTPLYDVMSAWPVIGVGPNKFDRKKLKLAMGVRGKNMHYLLDEIRRQHWNATAKRNAMGIDFEEDIALLLKKITDAINVVAMLLPSGFPAQVSDSIFEGICAQAGRLAEMGQLDGPVKG